ncbi:GntR family transcriptional regulator [Clostridium sp. YIM B02505]|uniref:GntR family transcriptional regulator n=1 Tax=Clostridium yunnanense TaxID=2800325 RepID=A0ABS1EVU1_9CLOT|nr:GntR family transcriptional regulator [Clostridium yunnanense]MBK1813461.1 GntR family transcriptional regulator [Clostridium yunnanense]
MTKYMQIANDIRNQIVQGTLQANEQLPFEKDLCEKYDASKMTVKKALDILVSEGLIVKRRGSGTFVKSISSTDMNKLLVSNQFRGLTALYSTRKVTSELLKFEVIASNEEIKSKLNLENEEFVYSILRVRYLDNNPFVMENTYMPIGLIPGLKKQHALDSIYSYIENDLGLKVQSSHRTIRVRKSNELEQEHLQLEPNDPVAVVEQVAYFENGSAFEYSISIHRYDRFAFETVIVR